MSASDDELLHQLDQLGPEHVRTLLARCVIPDDWDVRSVVQWLAEKDYEVQRSKLNDQQPTAGQSLAKEIVTANKKSAWALTFAIFSLILSGAVIVFLVAHRHGT